MPYEFFEFFILLISPCKIKIVGNVYGDEKFFIEKYFFEFFNFFISFLFDFHRKSHFPLLRFLLEKMIKI